MSKPYKITYQLIYEGNSKSTYGTTLNLDRENDSEVIQKIKNTRNFNGKHIKEIVILEMIEN